MSDQGQQPGGFQPQPPGDGTAPPPPPPPPGTFPEQPPVGQPAQPAGPQPQQQPYAPQQPQPQPYAQPQPQPQPQPYAPAGQPPYQPAGPQPPYGQPAAAPPAPKKRTGLIIGLIVGLLVLCGLGGCVGLFIWGSSQQSTSSADKAAVAQAEKHFSAAMDSVDKADKALTGASSQSPAQVTVIVTTANKELRTSRDEVAAAKASAEQLKDSQGKTDYLASLAAATKTLDALQDMLAVMDSANGMSAKVTEAGKLAKAGNEQLNYAVGRANGSSYGDMRRQALAASTNYTKAALLFREAAALEPTAGLDKLAVYCDKRKAQADVVVRMADEGKAGKYAAYNADIKKQNALGDQANTARAGASIDGSWGTKRLADVTKAVEDASKQADELRAKALSELGITK